MGKRLGKLDPAAKFGRGKGRKTEIFVLTLGRNQDGETIAIYQMISVFDPSQKDAFTFTSEELLRILRPIHDSIYGPTQAGYDPLKVLFCTSRPYSF